MPSVSCDNCDRTTYNVEALFRKNTLALEEAGHPTTTSSSSSTASSILKYNSKSTSIVDEEVMIGGDPLSSSKSSSNSSILLNSSINSSPSSMKRVLQWPDLVAYGISSTVGAGIFVVTGQVAKQTAGPSTCLSFVVAALAALLSAFCYAEFAARVPLSGSAYTFSYVVLGELIAWFIGWNLTLEYAISASAIARSWAGYVVNIFQNFGVDVPNWLYNIEISSLIVLSPLSLVVIFVCTFVLLFGVKSSAYINNVMTVLNILIILFIIITGSFYITPSNWEPFTPFGIDGILAGAGTVFFSYIGFDSVTTLAGEVKNPSRDLPIGILGTICLVTVLYIGVTVVLTGMVDYNNLCLDAPLSDAFSQVNVQWAAKIVSIGSATTLTATTFASLMGQPRIFYQMAIDGLLYKPFAHLTKASTPIVGTIISGAFAAIFAFFLPLGDLTEMISIGTLLAFIVVCSGIVILRYQDDARPTNVPLVTLAFVLTCGMSALSLVYHWPLWSIVIYAMGPLSMFVCILFMRQRPDQPLVFMCPLVPFVPCLGIYINMFLIVSLPAASWMRVLIWTILGFVIYFTYGIRFSRQGLHNKQKAAVERGSLQEGILGSNSTNPTRSIHRTGTFY